jgi:hypothetical protein
MVVRSEHCEAPDWLERIQKRVVRASTAKRTPIGRGSKKGLLDDLWAVFHA